MCDINRQVNENTVCDVDTYQVGEYVNFSKRCHECVARADAPPVSVRGNLSRCFNFWEKQLNSSPAICDIVRTGFKLSFVTTPPKTFLRNNRSSLKEPLFVQQAILDLLLTGCIEKLDTPPRCVNPLTVAHGKKLRLVIDLRHINQYIVTPSFKYEDLHPLSQMFQHGYWFFTWDLKSGYHHVDIYPPHRPYLGFAWPLDGKVCYFQFNVLPFGLSTACYCFTKLLRPLVRRWRSMSHAAIVFLDDGISGHSTQFDARAASLIQQHDLHSAGFTPNIEKCHWLGMLINTIRIYFQENSLRENC
jgi:hypothetical protein